MSNVDEDLHFIHAWRSGEEAVCLFCGPKNNNRRGDTTVINTCTSLPNQQSLGDYRAIAETEIQALHTFFNGSRFTSVSCCKRPTVFPRSCEDITLFINTPFYLSNPRPLLPQLLLLVWRAITQFPFPLVLKYDWEIPGKAHLKKAKWADGRYNILPPKNDARLSRKLITSQSSTLQ